MAKRIISFGFRHGIPILNEKDRYIDVRKQLTKNPFHNKALRSLRGDDIEVIADLEQTPNLEKSYNHIKAQAIKCEGDFYVGCTGGHHRSVYIANRLSKDLDIEVMHLNYNTK